MIKWLLRKTQETSGKGEDDRALYCKICGEEIESYALSNDYCYTCQDFDEDE